MEVSTNLQNECNKDNNKDFMCKEYLHHKNFLRIFTP